MTAVDQLGKFEVSARYSYLKATYRSDFLENSASNSTADASGAILVGRGALIPGLPQHSLKLRVEYASGEIWSVAAAVSGSTSIYARGDENNSDVHGRIPGFAVVNLDGRCRLARDLELFARIDNLFDRRYANFGVLGENVFTGPERTFGPSVGADPVAEQFRGPGVPRGAWVGLRYRWT